MKTAIKTFTVILFIRYESYDKNLTKKRYIANRFLENYSSYNNFII